MLETRAWLHTEHEKDRLVGVEGHFLQIHPHQLLHRLPVPALRYQLALHLRLHRPTGSQQERGRGNFLSSGGGGIYLGLALQVGLAELFYRPRIQRLRGQVVGHMVCHVDQPDEGSLEPPNPEVFHQPAVARLVHVHKHKQDLKCAKHTNICFLIVICLCFGSMVDVSVLL